MSGEPAAGPRPLLVAAGGAALVAGAADCLFWGAAPGLSVAVFVVLLAAVVVGAGIVAGRGFGPVWPLLLLGGAAGAAAIDFGFANFCVLAVLFLVLAGERLYGDRPRLWARAVSQAAASLRFPLAIPRAGWGVGQAALGSPWGTAVRLARVAAIVVPALGLGLLFAVLLGTGNAVFGSWFGEAWKGVWHGLEGLSFGRLCFALFTGSVALTLLVPARVGPRWWAWMEAGSAAETELPRYLYWQAVAVLAVANGLFLAANGADIAYLWARRAIPPGVNAAAYVHEGTGALIAAVLVAGGVQAVLFRRRGALLPQRAPRLLACLWTGQCLFLLASVVLRLVLYVREFGMTAARVELACFLLLVGAGFVLLAAKIVRDKSLPWLLAANAVAVFTLFYALQFWDLGGFVAKWNVDRWKAHPDWPLDVAYLANGELGPGAWKQLRRVAEAEDRPLAAKAAAIFLEKMREMPPISPGWRSWQAIEAWNRKDIDEPGRRPLGDACWEGALFSPEDGVTILLERQHLDDTPLAEYRRKLAVRHPDGGESRLELIMDTGGTVQMNVYRDASGSYVFRDRIEDYRLDMKTREIGSGPRNRQPGEVYLGCFDERAREGMSFFPELERKESQPPHSMDF